jgi:branched-subunit amino acid ABC-type transport system permease component
MIIDAFVIVIIGGMGSFPGSLIGALWQNEKDRSATQLTAPAVMP